jgi:phthalate 4,5-cis-dihydrodiol dehydrogenase
MGGPVGIGVAGLSRAFVLMAPTFAGHPDVRLVAAADPRAEARSAFTAQYGGRAYDSVEALCSDPAVELIYVASPHQFHCAQALAAFAQKRHVMVEKPMALTLEDCDRMVAAAEKAGCHLLVGHSHSFDRPYLAAAAVIASGEAGPVRMITALNHTDFMYRPRRPEELSTEAGGGVIFSQAAHQVDIVRLLAGGQVRSVSATVGRWDPSRPTEGAYQATLLFEGGAVAALTYNGYGHFDSDELFDWRGELGQRKDAMAHGAARQRLEAAGQAGEAALKDARAFGAAAAAPTPAPVSHNHFGQIIVSCERGDLRPVPDGVHVYLDRERRFIDLGAPALPRPEVVEEIVAVLRGGRAPLHSGAWGRATLEVCLGMLESARTGQPVPMMRQVAVPA